VHYFPVLEWLSPRHQSILPCYNNQDRLRSHSLPNESVYLQILLWTGAVGEEELCEVESCYAFEMQYSAQYVRVSFHSNFCDSRERVFRSSIQLLRLQDADAFKSCPNSQRKIYLNLRFFPEGLPVLVCQIKPTVPNSDIIESRELFSEAEKVVYPEREAGLPQAFQTLKLRAVTLPMRMLFRRRLMRISLSFFFQRTCTFSATRGNDD